jgi:hypothetical protein
MAFIMGSSLLDWGNIQLLCFVLLCAVWYLVVENNANATLYCGMPMEVLMFKGRGYLPKHAT